MMDRDDISTFFVSASGDVSFYVLYVWRWGLKKALVLV